MPAKPDLSEYFKLAQPKRKPCRIAWIKEQLEEQEAVNLEAACKTDPGLINTGAIRSRLSSLGFDASVPGITAHRRGECTCGRRDQ